MAMELLSADWEANACKTRIFMMNLLLRKPATAARRPNPSRYASHSKSMSRSDHQRLRQTALAEVSRGVPGGAPPRAVQVRGRGWKADRAILPAICHRLHSRICVVVALSGTLRESLIPLQTLQQTVCKDSP